MKSSASSRPGSFDQKGLFNEPLEPGGLFPIKKSQDAAVGALVCMLKKAPPLRQDLSSSINSPEATRPEMWRNSIQDSSQIPEAPSGQHATSLSVTSSGLVASKTTADALEELQSYKDMKNLLLSQGARSHSLADYASTTYNLPAKK